MDILDEPIDAVEKMRREMLAQMEADALKHILSSRLGRRFLYSHMRRAGLDGFAFTGDNNYTNFNFGRQSVATDLKADISALNGEALILMMREIKEDESYVNGNTHQLDTSDDYDPTR